MFNRVKMKLVILNLAVVGIILLLFFLGIYFLMKQNNTRQSEQLLRTAVLEIRRREQRPSPPGMRQWGNWFYVRFDASGNMLGRTTELPVSEEEFNLLVNEAIRLDNDKGKIKLKNETFRFLRSIPPQPDRKETILVFLNTQIEKETLERLGTILVFTYLTGLIVVFLFSLFLAEKALVPIKKSWERQKNFVADASHELRSPLAVVQTSLELVMGNKDETVESQMRWLENIYAENKRMTKLVNDLLLLARVDSEQQVLEKHVFPLHRAVYDSAAAFGPVAERKNVQLEIKLENEFDIFGDESRIKQLMVILIDNAVKYTPSGGLVTVSLKERDNTAEIIVADTGEGIEDKHLNKIFERFYRVDKSRSRESGGTGLGLSIADWIVKEHKGSITVSSTPGKGSTFKVLLPILLQKG